MAWNPTKFRENDYSFAIHWAIKLIINSTKFKEISISSSSVSSTVIFKSHWVQRKPEWRRIFFSSGKI